MEYHLEIYRPGSCSSDGCHKNLYCGEPILADSRGELINTKTWDVEWPLLRVVNVEHVISESSRGIDPSGTIIHRIFLYTESIPRYRRNEM